MKSWVLRFYVGQQKVISWKYSHVISCWIKLETKLKRNKNFQWKFLLSVMFIIFYGRSLPKIVVRLKDHVFLIGGFVFQVNKLSCIVWFTLRMATESAKSCTIWPIVSLILLSFNFLFFIFNLGEYSKNFQNIFLYFISVWSFWSCCWLKLFTPYFYITFCDSCDAFTFQTVGIFHIFLHITF